MQESHTGYSDFFTSGLRAIAKRHRHNSFPSSPTETMRDGKSESSRRPAPVHRRSRSSILVSFTTPKQSASRPTSIISLSQVFTPYSSSSKSDSSWLEPSTAPIDANVGQTKAWFMNEVFHQSPDDESTLSNNSSTEDIGTFNAKTSDHPRPHSATNPIFISIPTTPTYDSFLSLSSTTSDAPRSYFSPDTPLLQESSAGIPKIQSSSTSVSPFASSPLQRHHDSTSGDKYNSFWVSDSNAEFLSPLETDQAVSMTVGNGGGDSEKIGGEDHDPAEIDWRQFHLDLIYQGDAAA